MGKRITQEEMNRRIEVSHRAVETIQNFVNQFFGADGDGTLFVENAATNSCPWMSLTPEAQLEIAAPYVLNGGMDEVFAAIRNKELVYLSKYKQKLELADLERKLSVILKLMSAVYVAADVAVQQEDSVKE
jgi:hypothetical protein